MITLINYKKICKICDEILLIYKNDISINAISFLSNIRPHGFFLKKINMIYSKRITRNLIFIFILIKNLLIELFNILSSLFNSKSEIKKLSSNQKIDIIIVSHFNNTNKIFEDRFFGEKIKKLYKKNFNIMLVYFNYTNLNIQDIHNRFNDSYIKNYIFIKKLLSFYNEIMIFKYCINNFIKLFFHKKNNDKYYNYCLKYSAIDSFSTSTINNLRYYEQIKRIIKTYSPKMIITTMEGHVWEKLTYKATNEISKSIIKAGYTHSILFNSQHSVYNFNNNLYNPNYIFVNNDHNKKEFLDNSKFKDDHIYNIGSTKSNIDINSITKINLDKNKYKCLVLPEGFKEENIIFLKFIKKYLMSFNNVEFIYRKHPDIINLNKKYFIKYSENENFKYSKHKNLKDDINNSDLILYRGSAAIIDSLIFNRYLFYLSNKEEITINPLHQNYQLYKNISNINEMNNEIIDIKRNNIKEVMNNEKEKVNISKEYSKPSDTKLIEKLFNSI